jgi:cytochrome c551/c552
VADKPIPEQDPIVTKSYAGAYLIASVLMVASLLWALWDENYTQRPWKQYQEQFKQRFVAFLNTQVPASKNDLSSIENDSEYKQIDADYKAAVAAAKPQEDQLKKQLEEVTEHLAAVQAVYTDNKALFGAKTYSVETGTIDEDTSKIDVKEHQQRLAELEKDKSKPEYEVDYPADRGKKYSYNQLDELYNHLREEKARLVTALGDAQKPYKEIDTRRQQYITDHITNLTPEQVRGLRTKYEEWDPTLNGTQINVAEANIVDRCESCHMGVRQPVVLTAARMTMKGSKPDEYSRAFVSHPSPELLSIHDPDKFGCSPCHQGNGRATTSIEKAHGNYEHWLWPLFPGPKHDKNGTLLNAGFLEAGCQTCHAADRVLYTTSGAGGLITQGKDLYNLRGCVGCHRYEGYDREPEELSSGTQQIKLLESQIKENLRLSKLKQKQADDPNLSGEEAQKLNQEAEALVVTNSKLAGQIEQVDLRAKSLLQDVKKVGPNLKDIKAKLNKGWIPVWIHKPTDFRPSTRMPNFRLTEDQMHSIAAYLWQNALNDQIPHAKPGNAAHGKDLFETRGCLACHSFGEGSDQAGGPYANLTRIGEKVNYDYLARWIHNPRLRLRPYCPYEKKDIGPEDYARKGLPFQFDADHSQCPNDGHELQIQQTTIMPMLRLSEQDAADIATYLMSQKQKEPASYGNPAYMDDPKLADDGKKWIRQFGCAGCHEIKGFEDEGRIGTELTVEGSKPIERLDFALLTHQAEIGGGEPLNDPNITQLDATISDYKQVLGRVPENWRNTPWYSNRGFFEHKLAMPNIYDKGKIKGEMERLRMPDPHLTRDQIQALTTFLLGSQETSLPASYLYKPQDYRGDIQEGWWIVGKYGCMNCHQFYPGQKTVLMDLPRYKESPEKLPPKLLTEGARVDPDWLMRFLSNPALDTKDTNRNGVRPYLDVRMPTFNFSNDELRKLVRFFQALSRQPLPYIQPPLPTLSARELEMGRSLFSSQAAPCLKCHATGDAAHDRTATAPNFLLAKDRLKPGWTERWLLDPAAISPGTAMPSGLFRKQTTQTPQGPHEQWVFNGPVPPSFQGYDQDHTKLLVRYIFQLTAQEQRAVSSRMPKSAAPAKTSSLNHKGSQVASRPPRSGASGSR